MKESERQRKGKGERAGQEESEAEASNVDKILSRNIVNYILQRKKDDDLRVCLM